MTLGLAKVSVERVAEAGSTEPVPVSVALALPPVKATVKVAVTAPKVVGEKVILIVQLVLAENTVGQLLV
jgi:hypothetical protein